MPTPILSTKLYIPPLRPNAVKRPHLISQLNAGLHRKLTLISAPAGFGKTTLLSEWIAKIERPTAWLSLDDGENDPTRFLVYLVAALQTITTTVGEGVLRALQSLQPPPLEAMLTTLLNDLNTIKDPFVLVLDDYHVINAKPVDQALAYLVTHLPPHFHLVIATREDPRLPLARLRAQNHLTELRTTHLRFTPSEAATFLNHMIGLTLSAHDITILERRTEGWIAGLQLAALSIQGQQDISQFIQNFAGNHRYIVDYLAGEVLQRLSEPVRSFLLQTSILDRLSGSLCNAVTGQEDGTTRLEFLERGNFFVIPLDDKRHWYRYHHLFAEVLYTHLIMEQPDQIITLHLRASMWYEQNSLMANAIHHALTARDFERAAHLIELAVPTMRRNRQEAMLLSWLKKLPDTLIRFRPVLSMGYVWALLATGDLKIAHTRLKDAEQWLNTTADSAGPALAPSTGMVIVDKEEFRHLPASIALYHAAYAQIMGDIPNTVKYAQQVLDLLPEQEILEHGAAVALLGLAHWTNGDLEVAYRTFADGLARVQVAGNIADAINGTIALADIRIVQGRLREAMRIYEHSLQKALEQSESGEPALQGTADLYVGMSELYHERNDLNTAVQYLLKGKEEGKHTGLLQNRYRWYVALAQIKKVQGDLDSALDLLYEAERLYRADFFPNIRPVAALKTRVWIAQQRLDEALDWVREQGLSTEDDLSYLHEFEHITLARVFLARYKSDGVDRSILKAMELLKRLLKAAQEGGRMGSVIEILILQALIYQTQDNMPAALTTLQQALMLAEPAGYVRIFVDEGPPMTILLEEVAKHGITSNYVRQLLIATGSARDKTPVKQVLVEPLSEREFEVLHLLRTDLNGPQIARELIVSLNTLRTHIKNIYSKLGVNNRRAAVRRAEDLNLFSRT